VPSSDAFITQVIPLTNVDASDVAAQIQGLVSPNANIIPTSTNSIIITDTAASIQRVLTLVADTEAQLSGGLRVFSLRYYDAGDMSDLVTSLVLGRGGAATAAGGRRLPYERRLTARPGQPAQGPRAAGAPGVAGGGGPEFCYADTRTNSLIVLATPIHTQQIQTLIEQLDRPISLRDSFFVYPVQNLVASDLAQKIGPLINAQVTVAPTGGGGRALGAAGGAVRTPPRAGTTTPFGAPGYGITTPLRTSSLTPDQTERSVKTAGVEVEPLSGSSSAHNAPDPIAVAQVPELPGLPVQPQPAAPPVQVTTQAPESAPSVPGPGVRQAVMTADDNTNTLLISASPEQLELVRQLLDQLDVSPPQVHIQAIIAEVSLTRNTSLGFQWESLGRTFGKFQGNPFTGDLASNFGESAPQKDASGNVTGPTGFSGQISGPLFHAVLNALTSDSHARILSAPSIFTSNNQPARIDVSNSRPFPTGTLTSTLGTGTAVSTSIQYQSVGIVLEVTPRVTQGDMVQMDVSVSADEVGQPVKIAGQEYPSTLARRANGNLIVKDGDTIILGGLMRDTINRTASRIPILGDLPIIGSLFRSTTSDREKSELLVFLTPHVVRGPTQATALTDKIKNNMMETPRSLQHPAEGSAEAPSKR
jgi:general secretion pathway protein D